ncbi:MAG: FAD-binding oxidoreductase [Alphaproteobacteria bacterium]|nr:FAD-binding oxidoreductase [Alphaproteobacteria bacterium]
MRLPIDPNLPASLWAETAIPAPRLDRLEGRREVDLAIIGGGFSGLSAALFARDRGLSVAVLEANDIGWGASGRNNGQIIPTLSKKDPADIIARFGTDHGERIIAMVRDSAELVFGTIRSLGIPCDAEQTGWIQPAHSPGRVGLARRRSDAWAAHGAPVEFYDRARIAELLGSKAYFGGWGNRTGGHVNPLSLARGLADAAQRAGVLVLTRTPARAMQMNGDRWELTTPSGRVMASRVILATNAYTDDLWPGLRKTIVTANSWQLATAPIADSVRASIVPGRQAVSDTRGELGFFRYDAANRLVTGGASTWQIGAEANLRERVGDRLMAWFPQLSRLRFDFVWSGKLAMTRDFFPHVHQLGDGVYAWIGCNGRGVALSFAMGRELARLAAGDDPRELTMPLTPLNTIKLHGIVNFVAPRLALWSYRRADRREISA